MKIQSKLNFLSGWGKYKIFKVKEYYPENIDQLKILVKVMKSPTIVRGNGRSYGDSSISKNIILLSNFKKTIYLDKKKGIVNCSANITFKDLNDFIVNKGFFPKVTPGSQHVSIGGAVASDVHGKNHHIDGSFCQHVKEIRVMNSYGKIKILSRVKNKTLFNSTCGGMGLTGIILNIEFSVQKINTPFIKEKKIKTNSLKETISLFSKHKKNKYIVAWIDTSSKNYSGRGIVHIGDHYKKSLRYANSKKNKNFLSIPNYVPNFIMNNLIIKIFNLLYFNTSKKYIERIVNYENFFYPLDKVKNINNIYGDRGFVQLHILIRNNNIIDKIENILSIMREYNQISFISTLKKMGKYNNFPLSFPEEGYSITIDVPNNKMLKYFYIKLQKTILKINGKIYLTKDSLMSKKFFKKTYSYKLNKFLRNFKRNKKNIFQSYQSKRLGIR
jgi:decaprenylphospho-beta-D-ribofuranose 2-oxidase